MTVVGVTAILAFFALFAIYITADIEQACAEAEAATQVGASEASSNGTGDRAGDTGANTASGRPFDWAAL